jgi:hypothetical protein
MRLHTLTAGLVALLALGCGRFGGTGNLQQAGEKKPPGPDSETIIKANTPEGRRIGNVPLGLPTPVTQIGCNCGPTAAANAVNCVSGDTVTSCEDANKKGCKVINVKVDVLFWNVVDTDVGTPGGDLIAFMNKYFPETGTWKWHKTTDLGKDIHERVSAGKVVIVNLVWDESGIGSVVNTSHYVPVVAENWTDAGTPNEKYWVLVASWGEYYWIRWDRFVWGWQNGYYGSDSMIVTDKVRAGCRPPENKATPGPLRPQSESAEVCDAFSNMASDISLCSFCEPCDMGGMTYSDSWKDDAPPNPAPSSTASTTPPAAP